MMSQPFARSFSCPTSTRPEDFMMMNNNYLPGISRMSLPFNRTPAPNGIHQKPQPVAPIDPSIMQQPNFVAQSNVINTCNTNLAEAYTVSDTIDNPDSLMTDICEHQGPPNVPSLLSTVTPVSQSWSSSLCNSSQIQTSSVSFTFTTPTQSYLYSPALTATTQNRFQYSRATPHNFAPGCNAQWQHSVPRQIPWRCQGMVSTNVSVFTGTQSSSVCSMTSSANMLGTSTYFSPQVNHPVASCSEVVRRPKRRHTVDSVDETSPQTKIHLTEEKIANHMRELNINQFSPTNESDSKGRKELKSLSSMCSDFVDIGTDYQISGKRKLQYTGLQTFGSDNFKHRQSKCGCVVTQSTLCDHIKEGEAQSTYQTQSDNADLLRHSQRQWHDFKLLEEKLEMIDEDSDSEDKSSGQPKLTIKEGINITPVPIIPQDIMEKIRNPCRNPCRDVILWSPPDSTVTKSSSEISNTSCHGNSCMDMMDESISPSTEQICTEKIIVEDSGMETDFMDDMLEL